MLSLSMFNCVISRIVGLEKKQIIAKTYKSGRKNNGETLLNQRCFLIYRQDLKMLMMMMMMIKPSTIN